MITIGRRFYFSLTLFVETPRAHFPGAHSGYSLSCVRRALAFLRWGYGSLLRLRAISANIYAHEHLNTRLLSIELVGKKFVYAAGWTGPNEARASFVFVGVFHRLLLPVPVRMAWFSAWCLSLD